MGDPHPYQYDDSGNTVGEVGPSVSKVYGWTAENRLVSFDDGTNAVAYEYDDDGLRTGKVVNASDVTGFLVDKNREYGQVLAEIDQGGQSTDFIRAANGVYSCPPSSCGCASEDLSRSSEDDLIAQYMGNEIVYMLTDGQSSTRIIVEQSGVAIGQFNYTAFGDYDSEQTGGIVNYLYRGERREDEFGAFYMRSRYYNQERGRYLSKDMFFIPDSNTLEANLYQYSRNNPLMFVDPSGNLSLIETSIAIGISVTLAVRAAVYATTTYCTTIYILTAAGVELPVPPMFAVCRARGNRWNCNASCNVEGTAPHCTGRVTGNGVGQSEYFACLNAKRDATQSAPLGCYARHCRCTCSRR